MSSCCVAEPVRVKGAWWKSFFLGFFALIPVGWLLRAAGVEPPPESAYIALGAAWLVLWWTFRRSSGRTAVVLDSLGTAMALWVAVPVGILAIGITMDEFGAPPWVTLAVVGAMVGGFVAAIVLWVIRTAQRSPR